MNQFGGKWVYKNLFHNLISCCHYSSLLKKYIFVTKRIDLVVATVFYLCANLRMATPRLSSTIYILSIYNPPSSHKKTSYGTRRDSNNICKENLGPKTHSVDTNSIYWFYYFASMNSKLATVFDLYSNRHFCRMIS